MRDVPRITAPPLHVPGAEWAKAVLQHDAPGNISGRIQFWYGVACYPATYLPHKVALDLARNPGVWGAQENVYVPWTSFARPVAPKPILDYENAGTDLAEVLRAGLPKGVFSTSGYGAHVLTGIVDEELFGIALAEYFRVEQEQRHAHRVRDIIERMSGEVAPLLEQALSARAPRMLRRNMYVGMISGAFGKTEMPFSGYVVAGVGETFFIYEFGERRSFKNRRAPAAWNISHTPTGRLAIGDLSTAADAARVVLLLNERWSGWADALSVDLVPDDVQEFTIAVDELYHKVVR